VTVVNNTRPTASKLIGRKLSRKSRQEVNSAAGYSNGGNKTSNTKSGSRRIGGKPGMIPIKKPPITSRIGYGIGALRATSANTATTNSKPKMTSSRCNISVEFKIGSAQMPTPKCYFIFSLSSMRYLLFAIFHFYSLFAIPRYEDL
jgi:hypothetical protein